MLSGDLLRAAVYYMYIYIYIYMVRIIVTLMTGALSRKYHRLIRIVIKRRPCLDFGFTVH